MAVGEVFEGTNVTLSVEGYRDDVEDGEYRALEVRACVKDDAPDGASGVAYEWSSWALYDGNDGRYQPTSSYNPDAITPLFPQGEGDGIYYSGDCVQGWILYEPAEEDAERAAFTAFGGSQYTVYWDLNA